MTGSANATKQRTRRQNASNNNAGVVSPLIDCDLFKQEVQVRSRRERKPMNPVQRLKTRAANTSFRQLVMQDSMESEEAPTNNNVTSTSRQKQFTVTTRSRRNNSLIGRLMCRSNPDDFTYVPSGITVKYINWTFKSSFAVVFLSFVVSFLLLVLVFGFFFKWAGEGQPECIVVAGKPFDYYKRGSTLTDGFGLSWTTFTTVGYGSTYIATGNEIDAGNSCWLITLLSTAESFIGLLYAGMCTAIMFSKVGRIQSHAQVTFSDTICVVYGKEKMTEDVKKTVLKLAVSKRFSYRGSTVEKNENEDEEPGEDQLGTVEEEDGDEELGQDRLDDSEKKVAFTDDDYADDDNDHKDGYLHYPLSNSPQDGLTNNNKQFLCPVITFQLINQLCNEGGGEILDANMNVMVRKEEESYPYEPIARFLRVQLEEPSHPYFNRVWHGRHVLNQNSPLVSVEARNRIRMNGGCWPPELNDPESIRRHLRFSSLIITMTGVSNVSAESVQISQRYYHHDMLVGYNFAPLLFKQEGSEMLKVDMSLANDVVEQSLLGGEKLTDSEEYLPSLRERDVNGGQIFGSSSKDSGSSR